MHRAVQTRAPIGVVACASLWLLAFGSSDTTAQPTPSADYLEFNYGQDTGGDEWVRSIRVLEPALRSDVAGTVRVRFAAPGMRIAKALCWQQPTPDDDTTWGHDTNLTPEGVTLDRDGRGSFTFSADDFPHGPMNVRIFARNDEGERDIFELQLYNTGGVEWNAGIPDHDPPAAAGMELVFSDDFDAEFSISNGGRGTRYNAHKPVFGDFSGWPFADPNDKAGPFEQVDTYLRIKARKTDGTKGATGLIATVDMDGKGFRATPPFYVECRFTAQSAPGTWPAFWTITQVRPHTPGDELDIAECYGGVGKGNPNHPGYSIVSHFWGQTNPDGTKKASFSARPNIMELGGGSYWSTTSHTYGVRVDREETVYYFDDIEVLRHPTNDESVNPHVLLANYAIGGISGWGIDLERYGNGSDMYIDYIRAYEKR